MAYNFKKIQLVIAAMLVAGTGVAQETGATEEACPEECSIEPCCSSCCGQLFIGAEALYLRAFEGGLSGDCDSTQIINTTEDGLLVSTLTGRGQDPSFKWNLGFRIGVGYEFADDCCGIGAYWTHYNSHSGSGSDTNAHKWRIEFDVIDAIYGCDYDYSDCFSLTPYGGVRYAKIDQKLHTNFVSTIDGVSTTSIGHLKEYFSGAGPLFGLQGDWRFGCGFSLYGNVSVAALYGTFHVRSSSTDSFSTGRNVDHLKKSLQACQAVLDLGFGIRWKKCLCGDRILELQLGLEQHRYFNHNQFCRYGDLSLDGVSFGMAIGF